jgi:DNA topoisomerase-1
VQLGEQSEGSRAKPPTSSLFKSMDPATVALEDALRLLSLPRVVGAHPEDDVEIVAANGRYGPYLKKGSDTRSLDSEEQLFTVTVEDAVSLFAQPKRRGRSAAVLKELGDDPTTGKPVALKEGRYGPYVTDGETNASLPKGENPDALTHEQAVELLAAKRAQGPSPRRKSSKKATRKKTTRKKRTSPKR